MMSKSGLKSPRGIAPGAGGSAAKATRRAFLVAGSAALFTPFVIRKGFAAGEVIVRTSGGTYEAALRKHVYDAFTKETGIVVTAVPATVAKLFAMFKSGNVELDLIDIGDGLLIPLDRLGALAPIAYDKWKWTDPNDLRPEYKQKAIVTASVYSSILGYSKKAFPNGTHPKSWAEFWDTEKFPGPRSLADMASGYPSLEFALLADGVPRDKLYPLDVPRAFKSLTRIRKSVRKFWDTGALAAQMLSDGEAVASHLWTTNLGVLIAGGAPLGLEMNENMIKYQALGVFKGARNEANAQLLIDYMLQPKLQAVWVKEILSSPSNAKALASYSSAEAEQLPGGARSRKIGFVQDVVWWEDNRDVVNREWQRWALG
jgi:putative spermidine/putrescine transport system substrate-binding protein